MQIYYRNTVDNGYNTTKHPWFYDFEDILLKAGISEDDSEELTEALNRCVTFKRATPSFMKAFDITHHSGLSMFIPYRGYDYLDNKYKETRWNRATKLVE